MSKSKKLVFFGNERLATGVNTTTPLLRSLLDNGYEVAAVVAHYSQGTSRKTRPLEIADAAKAHNIPLLLPLEPTEIIGQLASYEAEAGILVAYGKILPQEVIDIFPSGIINLHPSLLPAYRGPTPLETAILEGATTTGVSLMRLVASMDAGPVFAQQTISLSGRETKQELADKLLDIGSQLLLEHLPAILDGSLIPQPQDDSRASYTKTLQKTDGLIDWETETAQMVERKVRAYHGFPKTSAKLFGKYPVIVTKARVVSGPDQGNLTQKTKDGYLEIVELIAPSGKLMSGADFKLGYKA